MEAAAPIFVDERVVGVAPAMRRQIAAALDVGDRPALVNRNLRLGSIVLQRADGRDAPALREVELQMLRRNVPTAGAFDTFSDGHLHSAAIISMLLTQRANNASSRAACTARIASRWPAGASTSSRTHDTLCTW